MQGLKTERVTLKVRRAVTRHRTSSEGSSSSTDLVSVTPAASDMELSQEEREGKSDDEVNCKKHFCHKSSPYIQQHSF